MSHTTYSQSEKLFLASSIILVDPSKPTTFAPKPDNLLHKSPLPHPISNIFLPLILLPRRDMKEGVSINSFLCGDKRGEIGRLLAIIKREYPELSPLANKYAIDSFSKNYSEISKWVEKEIANGFQTISALYQTKRNQHYYQKILLNI